METAGLVVGVAGLAGLFSVCQSAVDTFRAYQTSKTDSLALDLQFRVCQKRFNDWGRKVGLDDNQRQNPRFDDPSVEELVRELLDTIIAVMGSLSPQTDIESDGAGSLGSHSRYEQYTMRSKRSRWRWVLLNKTTRTEKVAQFQNLVEMLYHFIPPSSDGPVENEPLWAKRFREDLQKLRDESKAKAKQELELWLLGSQGLNEKVPNNKYEKSVRGQLKGTCAWIFDRPVFQSWISSDFTAGEPKLLWLHGPPGFGKTILCASIVQKLLQSPTSNQPVARFFFTSDLESRNDPFVAARSWVSQIVVKNDSAFQIVQQRMVTELDSVASAASQTAVLDLLGQILRAIPSCTLVADGLDECTYLKDGDDSVTDFLNALMNVIVGTQTRVLIVSRDEPEIRNALIIRRPERPFIEYRISPQDVQADTALFARAMVDQKLDNKSESIRSNISSAMSGRCGGQFLWIKLQEGNIRKGQNERQLQKAIEETPTGLNTLYDQMWRRIEQLGERDRLRVFDILRWAAFSQRPLKVSEISEAVLLDDDQDMVFEEDRPDEIDEDYINTEILELCGSLVEVRSHEPGVSAVDRTVHLSHFTVKQYMRGRLPMPMWLRENDCLRASFEQLHHTRLAKACLSFLMNPNTWEDPAEGNGPPALGMWSLREYATRALGFHSRSGLESHETLSSSLVEFFDQDNPYWRSWKKFSDDRQMRPEGPNPLFYAVFLRLPSLALTLIGQGGLDLDAGAPSGQSTFSIACTVGLLPVVKVLFASGASISTQDKFGCTPLFWATMRNQAEVVEFLVENGADVMTADNRGWTPLHQASRDGHVALAQYLIKMGAQVSALSLKENTPLHHAAWLGHAKMVQLLLDHGADPGLASYVKGSTPLHLACGEGHIDVVNVLLKGGADMFAQNLQNESPLFRAAIEGRLEVVKLLLSKGASVESRNLLGYTPLGLAVEQGHFEVATVLLNAGSPTNTLDWRGHGPAIDAAKRGDVQMIELLLDRGVEVESKTSEGNTLIHVAAYHGHIDAVKLLLERGANLDGRGQYGQTPFFAAASVGQNEAAILLLDRGADIMCRLDGGVTALFYVSSNGRVETVKMLLDRGAKIDGADDHGRTPLYAACQRCHIEVAKVLLERGADIAATTPRSRTIMDAAVMGGDVEVCKLLLDRGAKPTPVTAKFSSLHLAANEGFADIVELLLQIGDGVTDLDPVDAPLPSPLLCAAFDGHIRVTQLLLERGANPMAQDPEGCTPLHITAGKGHFDMVKLLLGHEKQGQHAFHSRDHAGQTPLHFAARYGQVEIIKLLLEHEAKIHERNITQPASNTQSTLVNIRAQDGHSAIDEAIRRLCLKTVNILLHAGAHLPPESSFHHNRLLIWACRDNHLELFRAALGQGGSKIPSPMPDCKSPWASHSTLLHLACREGHLGVVKLLLEKGDTVAPTETGETPLHKAAMFGHLEVVQELLQYEDTDPNAIDFIHCTPLFLASRYGHVSVVKALIEDSRVAVNSANWYGSTAIWAAVRNGHHQVAEVLLPLSKVSADSRDVFGHTLLWWAQKTTHFQLIQLLSQEGRDPVDPYLPEHEDREPHETPQSCFDRYSAWCDVCTLFISKSSGFRCRGCLTFCMCKRCHSKGFRCLDESHELIPRSSSVSKITKVASEQPSEAENHTESQDQPEGKAENPPRRVKDGED